MQSIETGVDLQQGPEYQDYLSKEEMLRWLFLKIPFSGYFGQYMIWLRIAPSNRILAWRGNGEAGFRHNLQILQRGTGLPVTRG